MARTSTLTLSRQQPWRDLARIYFPSKDLSGSAAQFNGSVSLSPPPNPSHETTLARGGLRDTLLQVSHHRVSRTLKVHLTNASPDLVHDFRNFGEEVWSALREDYAVSLEEIDASTSQFHLREIPKREVRTVAAQVRKLVERYRSLVINVDEIKEGVDG